MENTFAGIGHLAGKKLAIWADGAVLPDYQYTIDADNQFATFQETFEDPNGDVATRWPAVTTSPGELSIESSGGVAGGKFLRIGNNSGNDEARLAWYKSIPFDPMRLYRLRFRIRRTAGSGLCYAGLSCRNAADNAYVAYDGSTSGGGVHWIAATARQPADWTLYTAYFKGTAATGDNTEHASPSDPAVLHENVRYIRPMFMVNYNDAAGTFDIDFVSLEILPEDAGTIVTHDWYNTLIAGLPYTSTLETMPLIVPGDNGPALHNQKRVTKIWCDFYESIGATAGASEATLQDVDRNTTSTALYTEWKEISDVAVGWFRKPTVWIRQEDPAPMTVRQIEATLRVGQ